MALTRQNIDSIAAILMPERHHRHFDRQFVASGKAVGGSKQEFTPPRWCRSFNMDLVELIVVVIVTAIPTGLAPAADLATFRRKSKRQNFESGVFVMPAAGAHRREFVAPPNWDTSENGYNLSPEADERAACKFTRHYD